MSGIFEHLSAFDEEAQVANRQAIAVANKRFNDKFAGFLRQASTKKEFASRLALVDTDINNMIEDVVNEYGGDAAKIAAAVKRSFEFTPDAWTQAVDYIIQKHGTQGDTEENARLHLNEAKDQIMGGINDPNNVQEIIQALENFYRINDLGPDPDRISSTKEALFGLDKPLNIPEIENLDLRNQQKAPNLQFNPSESCQNCGDAGCEHCTGDPEGTKTAAEERPERLKAQDEIQLADEHSQVPPWLKKQIQDEDQEDGGNLRNKEANTACEVCQEPLQDGQCPSCSIRKSNLDSQPIANPVPLAKTPGYTAGGESIEKTLENAPSAVGTGVLSSAHKVEEKGDKFYVTEKGEGEVAGPFDTQEDAYARANELNDLENLEKEAGLWDKAKGALGIGQGQPQAAPAPVDDDEFDLGDLDLDAPAPDTSFFEDMGDAWREVKKMLPWTMRNPEKSKQAFEQSVKNNVCPQCSGQKCQSCGSQGTFLGWLDTSTTAEDPQAEYNRYREQLGVMPIDYEFDLGYDDDLSSLNLDAPAPAPGLIDKAKGALGIGQGQPQAAPAPVDDDEFDLGYDDPLNPFGQRQTSVTPAMARALALKHAAETNAQVDCECKGVGCDNCRTQTWNAEADQTSKYQLPQSAPGLRPTAASPETGDKTEKREKLPTGDESALDGPSPKIDKKKWVPNATNPNGNLKPIDTEDDNSPVPTRHMDIKEKPDYQNNDAWENDNNVWSRENLPSADDNAGFNTERNISQDGQSGTFPDKGQTNPVTRKALAAWYDEDSLFRRWLADHGIELFDHPDELKQSPVIRSLWKQFVQDVPAPSEGDVVPGERKDVPVEEPTEIPVDEPMIEESPVEDLIEEPLEEPVEEETIIEETPEDVEEIIEREDKEGDRVEVIDEGDEDVDLLSDEDLEDLENFEETDPFENVEDMDDDEISRLIRDYDDSDDEDRY